MFRLRNLDRRLELAAASLGAAPRRVLMTITLPLLLPGLVSGWLFAAILSFNEFTASLFVTTQHTQTLPVVMYNYVREYADPSMAALSVIYIIAIAGLLTAANVWLGLEGFSMLTATASMNRDAGMVVAKDMPDVGGRFQGVTKRFGEASRFTVFRWRSSGANS